MISKEHIKLISTPTAGVPGEHSPYYRRLISAGYKGYIQGSLGGATLYGVMGLAVGAVVAVSAVLLGAAAGTAALAIPLMAGYGVLKGADTFGNIGSSAAQLAEFAEKNERRRTLIDRLGETQSLEEAKEIRKILSEETVEQKPKTLFKWKTALAGAAIGAILVAGIAALPGGFAATYLPVVTSIATKVGITQIIALGAVVGAASGAMIGLDRHYVRRWMDGAEDLVHDQSKYKEIELARTQQAEKLSTIARTEEQSKSEEGLVFTANNNLPTTNVSTIELQQRVIEAMEKSQSVS
jgi:hypothetical protein